MPGLCSCSSFPRVTSDERDLMRVSQSHLTSSVTRAHLTSSDARLGGTKSARKISTGEQAHDGLTSKDWSSFCFSLRARSTCFMMKMTKTACTIDYDMIDPISVAATHENRSILYTMNQLLYAYKYLDYSSSFQTFPHASH